MRIIDNRYKIENSLDDTFYYEQYKVCDLWEGDKTQLMKLYNHNIQNQIIDYFTDNFIHLSNIRHKYLLSSKSFNLVKTIDTKKTNMLLYYSIVEYVEGSRLSHIKDKLDFHERLKIILDTMIVIDFLHFRGFTYKLLSPSEIFITEDKSIKLMDLPTNIEKRHNSHYDDLSRCFILPEALINKERNDKKTDYYSIGTLIKYLLLEDFTTDDIDAFRYKDMGSITGEQKDILNSIIKQLTKRDFINKDLNLIEIVDKITDVFNFSYSYDLVTARNVLYFKDRIIGRKKEIEKFLSIDDNILRGANTLRGLIYNADLGVGKTRFLSEISYKLKMKGRDVYFIEIYNDKGNHLLDMSNILKQSIKDTPSELIEKYRSELSKILPELRLNIDEEVDTDLNQKIERFRLYNRISNYFIELSKDKIIYIIIDDIQKCNTTFIMILDYLIQNTISNNLFFIFSYDKNYENINPLIEEKINQWKNEDYILFMESHKLNLEEIGELVQSILGISYVPYNLASVLFKESQGNPRRIEYIIKHLFSIGELYMSPLGRWRLKVDSYEDLYIQLNIDDDFSKQLNIIKEKYFDIFKVMSIFGDKPHKRILLGMLEIEQKNIENILNELISLKLIDEKVADWGYSYNINSSELKKLIYNQIPEEEKIILHTKAAKVIQNFDDESTSFILEELLYHLIRSNQDSKALDIIFEEIKKIENKYGSQAKLLWEQAYDIVKDHDGNVKLEILENLVNIYYLKDETDRGKSYLEEYQKSANLLKNFNHIIKSKSVIADIYFRKGEKEEALKEIESIENISKEHDIIEGQIKALALKAKFEIVSGELKEAEQYLNKGIKLSKNNEIITYLGTLYNRLGLIKTLSGNTNKAIENYKKSIFYHESVGDFMEITRPINNIGIIYAEHYANSQKSMEYYKKGLAIAKKNGFQEVEIVFLNNIAESYMMNYEFDDALNYIEEARQGSLELQDFKMTVLAHINLGIIYIATSEYTKAYGCYLYLKEVFESKNITDLEINLQYHEFLGEFYGCFGQWEKAIEAYNIVRDFSKDCNIRDYLNSKLMILWFEFFNKSILNKEEIEELRNLYRNTEFIQDRRKSLLYLSIICFLNENKSYALELIEEDADLANSAKIDFLDKIREIILYSLDFSETSIENLIFMEEGLRKDKIFSMNLYLNIIIGFILYSKSKYKESIKYLLDSLDRLYRLSLEIPDPELKFSYIKSKKGNLIKEKLVTAVKNEYNHEIDYTSLEEIDEKDLNCFFNITSIIDVIGSKELVEIIKLDYWDKVLDINNTEQLISRFTDDFKYNLDILLNYLGKETFAKKGFIIGYDEKEKDYVIFSSLDDKSDYKINKEVLALTDKHKMGILINNNFQTIYNQKYRDFLSNDIKGIICVPIFKSNEEINRKTERRKIIYEENRGQGYIYLETDKVLNRFDIQRLELVKNLSNLAFINLENNKLKLMAIQDKLTGVFTRKYYEGKLTELINYTKSIGGSFSLLMLDIDKFKNINDVYGHRKGDEILALIGETLKSTVRSSDIVARYGGEEFVVLLKNTKESEAKNISEKIRENVEKLRIQGIDYLVTVSIGISLYPQHSQFKEELIEKADQALYYAKETGRNKSVIWNTQMDNTINRVDKLAGILTGNTEEDNRNMLAIINILELIKENQTIEEKTFIFLGRIIETLDAEWATVMFIDNKEIKRTLSRARFNDDWIEDVDINYKIINRIIETRKGEFLIDWDNIENIDVLSGLPNWKSIIVLPLINNGNVKGILYISTSIKNKEFDFDNFNLSKNFGNIFSAII
jgi:diguanylate cyclase (GGDEF)-like protein